MELLAAWRPAYTMSGEEALAALDALHADAATRKTYQLQLLARLHETGHAKELSGQDTAGFLATRHRLNKPEVQRDLHFATALPKYPLVAAALPDPTTAYAEEPAGPATGYADPTAGYAEESADTGTVDEPGATSALDELPAADEIPGVEELPVLLHPAQAAAIVAALEAVPAAAMVPVENLQAAEEQLVEAGRYFSSWELRKIGKRVRDILDTDGPEPAEEAARRQEALRLTNLDHGVKISGFFAAENAELIRTSIEAAAKPRLTLDGERDPRSLEKRNADALCEVLGVAAAAGELPGHGGVKPHITVTIDLDDLKEQGREATGDLQFGDGLSASAVRRLACDADIIPVVLGAESEPLDVGQAQRYVTKAIRRALIQRDKGCVVCGMPPRYCHAHHIIHWIDGGPTSLDNLALVCGCDHLGVHAGHFTITITNGKAHVTRPTWADPPRPTRTSQHRPTWATTPRTTASRPASARPLGTTDESPAAQGELANGAPRTASAGAGDAGAGADDGNDPYWGQGPPDPIEPPIHPARAFPMVGDPPPLATLKPADFNPWGPEAADTG